jgi:hypothetical protein
MQLTVEPVCSSCVANGVPLVVGRNGYRCMLCKCLCCDHVAASNTPFCPDCKPSPMNPVLMRDDDGRRHVVIGWKGQLALVKEGKREYSIQKLDLEPIPGQNALS